MVTDIKNIQDPNSKRNIKIYSLGANSPGSSAGKESACIAGVLGSIPGLGRSLGGGHGNALLYSCLENPHEQKSLASYGLGGRKESDTTGRLSTTQ